MPMLSSERRRFLELATLQYMDSVHLAHDYLEARGISPEVAKRNGLGVVAEPLKEHEAYQGRLCIPYLTDAGPVGFTFRCMEDHSCKEHFHQKYLKPAGTPSMLFGVRAYKAADNFIGVCEGEMDTITLTDVIGIPALGLPGAEVWKEHFSSILQDFSRVYIFSDGDDAGQKMAKHVMIEVETAINIRLPSGEDVNSWYLKQGPEWFHEKIKGE